MKNSQPCQALVPYSRQYFTLTESMLAREALKRGNFLAHIDIVHHALIRSLGIPARLLIGETNYSHMKGASP